MSQERSLASSAAAKERVDVGLRDGNLPRPAVLIDLVVQHDHDLAGMGCHQTRDPAIGDELERLLVAHRVGDGPRAGTVAATSGDRHGRQDGEDGGEKPHFLV
jgi:hypothetical protein